MFELHVIVCGHRIMIHTTLVFSLINQWINLSPTYLSPTYLSHAFCPILFLFNGVIGRREKLFGLFCAKIILEDKKCYQIWKFCCSSIFNFLFKLKIILIQNFYFFAFLTSALRTIVNIRGGATCTPGGAGEPPQILNLYPIIVMFLQMNPLKF
jgi:hypothetical protein